MKKSSVLILALLTMGGLAGKASAVTVFSNGPVNGTIDAWPISGVTSDSDSFTLAGPAKVTEVGIGLWVSPGKVPTSVDWSIGTSAFGSDVDSGTASLTNTFLFQNIYGFMIYDSTFAVNESLSSGTYWLTLANAKSTGGEVFWDESDGLTSAQNNLYGDIGSESFELSYPTISSASRTFDPAGVPEPVSSALLGLAAAGLAGYSLKRRKIAAEAR